MAKRKTPKVANLRPEKISDEQLQKMQSLVKAISSTQNEVGVLETRKHNLLHQVFELQDLLAKLQEELQKDYGTTDISIADGSINYKENGQADS
jgi:hypothetical protein